MAKLNIIVATHGRFGEELVKSAEMLMGKTENVYILSLLPGKSFDTFYKESNEIFSRIEGPTIALVDIFGGTPSNVLTALTKKFSHKVLTGLNLPLFIDLYMKASMAKNIDLDQLITECKETYTESLVLTNERLKN
ncbi:PTS sugar transporter subunit IIA [Companilactobacillus sp. HBUAS59544]|uniref:PTS sugar transporter subunit IIA n=1 Tax=Companilactobacillus sp. HBUAS59544 TaxID=3109363 RepID=UPI002FEFFE3B